MQNCKINVLGTEYSIEIRKMSDDPSFETGKIDGYCCLSLHLIVIGNILTFPGWEKEPQEKAEKYMHRVLRHEIVHAFYFESGLSSSANCFSGAWCENEEMVDWIAIQSPKMFRIFSDLGILE